MLARAAAAAKKLSIAEYFNEFRFIYYILAINGCDVSFIYYISKDIRGCDVLFAGGGILGVVVERVAHVGGAILALGTIRVSVVDALWRQVVRRRTLFGS